MAEAQKRNQEAMLKKKAQASKFGKKKKRGGLNIRRLFGALLFLIFIAATVYVITVPSTIPLILEGKILESEKVCVVEEMNSTLVFQTSCGRFEWDTVSLPDTPRDNLTVGQSYIFTVNGIQFLEHYPKVLDYKVATSE